MLIMKKKNTTLINTSSAESLLPVHNLIHKNVEELSFDCCSITDPDPAHNSLQPVFASDGL